MCELNQYAVKNKRKPARFEMWQDLKACCGCLSGQFRLKKIVLKFWMTSSIVLDVLMLLLLEVDIR